MSQSISVVCTCGASYAREEVRLPIKDVGIYECHHCGDVIERWHGKIVPKFTLLSIPSKKATNVG